MSDFDRYVTLQALNDRERDEWMLTIHNLGKDGGYIKDEKVVPPSLLSGVGQFFVSYYYYDEHPYCHYLTLPTTKMSWFWWCFFICVPFCLLAGLIAKTTQYSFMKVARHSFGQIMSNSLCQHKCDILSSVRA